MRIIAGRYKGRTLLAPENERVKPTLDRGKEAIFDKLQFDIPNSNVLDLFAGSGALGLEAYSRNALSVTLVDIDTSLVRRNIEKLNVDVRLFERDAMKALEEFKERGDVFDIILLDPPFKSTYGEKAIEYIDKNGLLSSKGVIVWERAYSVSVPLNLTNLCVDKIKKYGTIQVIYLNHISSVNN